MTPESYYFTFLLLVVSTIVLEGLFLVSLTEMKRPVVASLPLLFAMRLYLV